MIWIWNNPLKKVKSFFAKSADSSLKKESEQFCFYVFHLQKTDDLSPTLIKRAVLENPWSLDTPVIQFKGEEIEVKVKVLSSEKGNLLEESARLFLYSKNTDS